MRSTVPWKKKACFIIAEISANHGQDLKLALRMIRQARECGADAVKFQAYTPDTLTIDVNNRYFRINHPQWGGQTLYQLYKKAYTPWEWFGKLKKQADDLGIMFFSTAFDPTSLLFLEQLGVPVHKIASFELVDIPLIEKVAATGKPLILSTGMADIREIKEAVSAARKGTSNIALLKCVSSYPADPRRMNLKTIPDLQTKFHLPIGLSDHSMGSAVSLAAVAMGACIVEKHFTISRRMKTPDSFFSLEPQEFSAMARDIRIVSDSLGNVAYGISAQEIKSRVFRRSLFAVQDIPKGQRFTPENVRSIRPSNGLPPKMLAKVLGRRAAADIKRGTPLSMGMLQ